jgi:colanic acid/amylovoran biosynthesis glycosyltransferase
MVFSSRYGERSLRRIAYTMSRFPKISETFVLYEMQELQRAGLTVEVFPLVRERPAITHAEAEAFLAQVSHRGPLSGDVRAAMAYWQRKAGARYTALWSEVLLGSLGSPKFFSRVPAVLGQASWMAQQMEAHGIEHLHAHFATHPALAAYVIHRLTGIPYSITVHAHDLYVDRTFLAPKLQAAERIITISQFNRDLIGRLYGGVIADKTRVIRCGVDLSVFQPRQYVQRNQPFSLLCVASLEDYKGHEYLVQACSLLRDQGVDFRCKLVGTGELRHTIEAQIDRYDLEPNIELCGPQPRAKVSQLMAEADVVVLPSVVTPSGKMEGIPVALMEAMACAVPVVATNISGIPELISDGRSGLLVPQRDSQALAMALARLANDPGLRQQLGQAGRKKIAAEYDLRRNALTLAELLGAPEQARTV